MADPIKGIVDAARKVISIGLEETRLTCPTRPIISILRDRMVRIRELLIPVIAAYDAAQAQKPVLASRNDLLREFAERFTLDGDYLRCRECNRPQIASRESEEFVHAASCKLSVSGGRPWVELQAILVQPAAAQAQPAHRPVGIAGERDPDHPCEEFAPGSPNPDVPEDTTEETTNG